MALRWDWKAKAGEVEFSDGEKNNWYEGNGLIIALNEWKENDEDYWSMAWFFADKDHAKNCLGLSKGHENIFSDNPIVRISITRRFCNQWKDICVLLSKAFPDIEIVLH